MLCWFQVDEMLCFIWEINRQYWQLLLVFWESSLVYFMCNVLSSPNFSVSKQIKPKKTPKEHEHTHLINWTKKKKKQKTFLVFLEIILKDSDAGQKGDTMLFTRACSLGSRDVFRQPVKQTEERTVPSNKKWTGGIQSCWILQKSKKYECIRKGLEKLKSQSKVL